jgi:hypothetical protein
MGVNVKNIWEICEFEDEVIYGNLKAERFAVELHQVLEGGCGTILEPEALPLAYISDRDYEVPAEGGSEEA